MKRILKKNINTKNYWNSQLKSGKWGAERGILYSKLTKYLPKKGTYSCLDIGCAAGHGIATLTKLRRNINFDACDFSNNGIIAAKSNYNNTKIRFFTHDILKDSLNKKYDYILIVETLEHVNDPLRAVKKYIKYCNKKLIITVPYKEQGWKEHIYSFDEKSFASVPEFRKYQILNKPGGGNIIVYLFEPKQRTEKVFH